MALTRPTRRLLTVCRLDDLKGLFQNIFLVDRRLARGFEYQPSLIDPTGPREDPERGFRSFAVPVEGPKTRNRSETFADHYSRACQFFISQTEPEQNHIVSALVFELSKVDTVAVRERMLSHLANIDADLADRVATGLGWTAEIPSLAAAKETRTDLKPSPALSILAKGPPPLKGRLVGCLVTDGTDAALLKLLQDALAGVGAKMKIVAPKVGGVSLSDGTHQSADFQQGGPSVLFDAIVVAASEAGVEALLQESAAVDFVRNAFVHLKVLGHTQASQPLLDKAGVLSDAGVVPLS